MKIKRTIDGKEYEFELTRQELNEAWWESQRLDLGFEADYRFDHNLASGGDYPSENPRTNGEAGTIPGSKAYRDAWREVFYDSWNMWEDGGFENFGNGEHPYKQIETMTLDSMLPYVKEVEKWLDAHPAADKEYIRTAVMKDYIKHINGEEPIGDIREICEKAHAS